MASLRNAWQSVWQWVGALPAVVHVAVLVAVAVLLVGADLVLLGLPVVIGLWLWESVRAHVRRQSGGPDDPTGQGEKTNMAAWVGHLAEMIIAMYVGMFVYMLIVNAPTALGFGSLLSSDLRYAGMILSMVVPMLALMRLQGHSWRMGAEMSAGMVVPVIICFGLLRSDISSHVSFLSWITDTSIYEVAHDGMLLGMMAVMLYRRGMYAEASHLATGHAQSTHMHSG
jgi:hypothetical protein